MLRCSFQGAWIYNADGDCWQAFHRPSAGLGFRAYSLNGSAACYPFVGASGSKGWSVGCEASGN